MPSIRRSYDPPANEAEFERLCLALLKAAWRSHSLQLYAARGERQNGVDIVDLRPGDLHRAAQCKCHNPRKTIPPRDIKAEVAKALTFEPSLTEYWILTTAKATRHAQDAVRHINREHAVAGRFSVHLMTWREIEDLLHEHPEVRRQFLDSSPNEPTSHGQPASDRASLDESVARYLAPIRAEAILGESIPRTEARQVIDLLESGGRRGVLVVGEAGVGKSGVIAQAAAHFFDAGWPVVALRLDRMEPKRDARALGEAMRLSDSPTAALRSVAGGRRCLLVIDQLDAVSASSGRHPDFFDRVAELVGDVRAHSNLRVLMGCRAFDLREDHRIRRLVHKERGIAEKVEVQTLEAEVVRDVVQRSARGPKVLSAKQLRLLGLPLNLWLWTTVTDTDQGADDVGAADTARALLDQYWAQKSRRLDHEHPRVRDRWLPCLDAILDYMGDHRVPSAPRYHFEDQHRDALAAMTSEHLLTSEGAPGARLAFPHETVFDYLFARRFIARGKRLLDLLRSRDQSLFLRTTVRQVLQHMRSGDCEPGAYAETLRSLLSADDVRFHIKEAVLAWMGDLDDPAAEEWAVLRDCIEAARPDEEWQWRRRTFSGPWFDLLWRLGYIQTEALCAEPDRICRMIQRLQWASSAPGGTRARAETICSLLTRWLERDGEWPERVAQVMQSANAADTPKWIDLYFRLERRRPNLVRAAFHHSRSRFFAQLPAKAPENALAVATATLRSSLVAWWSEVDRSEDPRENRKPDLSLNLFGHEWNWRHLAQLDPGGFIRDILPILLETARLATRRAFVRPDRPMAHQWWWANDTRDLHIPRLDWVWYDRSVGPSYGDESEILKAAEHAIELVWDRQPEVHAAALLTLCEYSGFQTPAFLLLRALRTCGPERAEWTIRLLLDSPSLLEVGYSDASYWVAREAIERASLWCSPRSYEALEAALIDYTNEYERSSCTDHRPAWTGRSGRLHTRQHLFALGRAQFTLLGALPPLRRSGSVRRRLAELRRRFDQDDPTGPTGIRSRAVGPPFSARWERMSDAQWLNAMRRHSASDVRGCGRTLLNGGADELARPLEQRAHAEPVRFANLFIRLPNDINPVYFAAILRGLTSSAKEERVVDPEAVWDVIRYGFALPGRPCGRWSWGLIATYSKMDVPADVLDVVVWYASEDPDPRPQDQAFKVASSGDREARYLPDMHGLNSVRGGMCWAIEALLYGEPARLERLRPALASLVDDPSLAVRTQTSRALLPMLNADADSAVEAFLRLCTGENLAIAAYPAAQEFLSYATMTHFEVLEPLLMSMLFSSIGVVRQEAAVWLAAAVYRREREVRVVGDLWSSGDPAVRTGLAQVACEVVTWIDHDRHGLAVQVLGLAFESGEEAVVAAASRCFWNLQRAHEGGEISLGGLSPLFDAFIDSPAFEAKHTDLLALLKGSGMRMPDVVVRAFERILAMETTKHRYFDTALIYRLYEDTPDAEVRRRCLDLIDGLLRRGDFTLQRTLAELDGDWMP